MSAVKERIIGAVTVMPDDDALQIWEIILHEFAKRKSWDDIPEEDPDEFDLKMLAEIEANPDCKDFISQEDLLKGLDV